jgi:hypothetical protein
VGDHAQIKVLFNQGKNVLFVKNPGSNILLKEMLHLLHVGGVPLQEFVDHSDGAFDHFLLCWCQGGNVFLQENVNLRQIDDLFYFTACKSKWFHTF